MLSTSPFHAEALFQMCYLTCSGVLRDLYNSLDRFHVIHSKASLAASSPLNSAITTLRPFATSSKLLSHDSRNYAAYDLNKLMRPSGSDHNQHLLTRHIESRPSGTARSEDPSDAGEDKGKHEPCCSIFYIGEREDLSDDYETEV